MIDLNLMDAGSVSASTCQFHQDLLALFLVISVQVFSLKVTCVLTACTLGSAPGPMLSNEYGKTLSFTYKMWYRSYHVHLQAFWFKRHLFVVGLTTGKLYY